MALDVEPYRHCIEVSIDADEPHNRHLSVIDIAPDKGADTLVFVHGYAGYALQWIHQLNFFSTQKRVIAFDLRGHGKSDDIPTIPYTMDGMVDDLKRVIKERNITTPFVLVAHSFGGAIAVEYIVRFPEQVSKLVLIGVPARFLLRRYIRLALHIPDPIFSFLARLIGAHIHAPQVTLKPLHDEVMARWDGRSVLKQLTIPALVIRGLRDSVFLRKYYKDVVRHIADVREVVIPGSEHLVQLESPEAVNRAIQDFLSQ